MLPSSAQEKLPEDIYEKLPNLGMGIESVIESYTGKQLSTRLPTEDPQNPNYVTSHPKQSYKETFFNAAKDAYQKRVVLSGSLGKMATITVAYSLDIDTAYRAENNAIDSNFVVTGTAAFKAFFLVCEAARNKSQDGNNNQRKKRNKH